MSEKTYDSLIESALENAMEDRNLAKEAYEHMKVVFEIQPNNPETMQGVMLTGQSAVKLLESMSRSNEQILKLAQMRQKDLPKNDEDEDERQAFDMDDIKAAMEKAKIKG